jgi:glycosyltransferase involved in cell wall biosynthesis
MNVCAIIPAYQPSPTLIEVTGRLCASPVTAIIVVDDGSGPEYADIFRTAASLPRVFLVRHAVNLGKGAALKSGLNYAYCEFPEAVGFVTADADGQHDPEDILKIAHALAADSGHLALGSRSFADDVPLRSRFGNSITVGAVRLLVGCRLRDTQTGLRGVPRKLVPRLLKIPSTGYEFELDMLMLCKHMSVPIREIAIRTIYLDGNASSHFNPLLDSMRIYFVLLRFSFIALLTALLDNTAFAIFLGGGLTLAQSQAAARLVALVFNYISVRRAVFLSRETHRRVLPRYVLLVIASGFVSYGLINLFVSAAGLEVVAAKLIAESLLFIANFTIQRDLVFTKSEARPVETDWDRYYESVPPTARLTRKITTSVLMSTIRRHLRQQRNQPVIVEVGGANSCFLDAIARRIGFEQYHVVDKNRYGLDLLRRRYPQSNRVLAHEGDILAEPELTGADLVFSVGLIEHFQPSGTATAVASHFRMAKPGGLVILSFPTPTWLYRAARRLTEAVGAWKFHDERPLTPAEVRKAIARHGEVLDETTIWPIVFTQRMIAARRRE